MSLTPTGLLNWGQGGLFGGGASPGALGMPNMGLLRFGAELTSPNPNAWGRAATALRQGAAFHQKLRQELAARETSAAATDAASAPGESARRGLEQALMLRLAALAESQRDQAAAPAAPPVSSSLRLPGNAISGPRSRAPNAGSSAGVTAGVSQRPAPPLRIRLDAQGRRIG
jgi:hypothetical protein